MHCAKFWGIAVNKIPALLELKYQLGETKHILSLYDESWMEKYRHKTKDLTYLRIEGLLVAEMFKQTHKTNKNCWKDAGRSILGVACTEV